MFEDALTILYINAGLGFWLFIFRLRAVFLIKKYEISEDHEYFQSNGWRINEFSGLIDEESFLQAPEHIKHELSIEFKLLKLLRFLSLVCFIVWAGFIFYLIIT